MRNHWFGIVCVIIAIASIPLALSNGWVLVEYSFFAFIGGLVAFIILANITHNYENAICTLAMFAFMFSFIVCATSFIVLTIRGFVHLFT